MTPKVSRASRTSSHLCGLITAVTSFMRQRSFRDGGLGRCGAPGPALPDAARAAVEVVRRLAVLGEVDALDLVLLGDPPADRVLDREPDERGEDAGPDDREQARRRPGGRAR